MADVVRELQGIGEALELAARFAWSGFFRFFPFGFSASASVPGDVSFAGGSGVASTGRNGNSS
ncbi:MAG TPA: hypothetical protein VI072_22610 [Polyangiaceae bacterium]